MGQMACPECRVCPSSVIETRRVEDMDMLRRTRECKSCGYRWTTMEIPYDSAAKKGLEVRALLMSRNKLGEVK